jgi:hypothetical protein
LGSQGGHRIRIHGVGWARLMELLFEVGKSCI